MLRATFLFLSLVSFAPPLPAQTAEPQTRTTEAVLSEIRQLRQDLRAAAIVTQKAQILIYRLHAQERLVERASENLQNAKNAVMQMEFQKNFQAKQLKLSEEARDHAESEPQRNETDAYISQLKSTLEEWNSKEQELQASRMEMETQLRIEQGKMDSLQAELDRLENTLENAALQASNQR